MKRINYYYRLIVHYTKITAAILTAIAIPSWAAYGGYIWAKVHLKPEVVHAQTVVQVPVTATSTLADFPILTKICKAESGLHQFKENGNVVRGIQNPSDIGICQINEPTWNDQARKLGYDIYTQEGNEAMAVWIFIRKGTDPWNSSKAMWSK